MKRSTNSKSSLRDLGQCTDLVKFRGPRLSSLEVAADSGPWGSGYAVVPTFRVSRLLRHGGSRWVSESEAAGGCFWTVSGL